MKLIKDDQDFLLYEDDLELNCLVASTYGGNEDILRLSLKNCQNMFIENYFGDWYNTVVNTASEANFLDVDIKSFEDGAMQMMSLFSTMLKDHLPKVVEVEIVMQKYTTYSDYPQQGMTTMLENLEGWDEPVPQLDEDKCLILKAV